MSSWLVCTCGQYLHKNLFAGAGVCIVVEDAVLDACEGSAGDAVRDIVLRGDVLLPCKACARIAIIRKTGETTIYAPEPEKEAAER